MNRPGLVAVGTVLVVLGAVWFAQGVGWLGGSPMTGVTLWAAIGPIVALVGLSVMGLGLTGRSNGDDAGR